MKNSPRSKLYYSISEVAELTGLQPYTLRAWEREYPWLRPKRARGKNRAYRARDIGVVLLIKHLLYEQRYTSQGVKQRLKAEPELVGKAEADLATMLDSSGRVPVAGKRAGNIPQPCPHGPAWSPGAACMKEGTSAHSSPSAQQVAQVLRATREELRALLDLF